jgi:hypothetical protein
MKDLNYWKKKLLEILEGSTAKSLEDILFPDVLLKAIPVDTQLMLLKARGFAPGTIREWKGKKYKKLSSGKWALSYEGTGSRGEQQAVRNVMNKINSASSMRELVEIVKMNSERFKSADGKTLPVIKEFLEAARGTEAGKKIKTKEKTEKENKLLSFPSTIENVRQDKSSRLYNKTVLRPRVGKTWSIKEKNDIYQHIVENNLQINSSVGDKIVINGDIEIKEPKTKNDIKNEELK